MGHLVQSKSSWILTYCNCCMYSMLNWCIMLKPFMLNYHPLSPLHADRLKTLSAFFSIVFFVFLFFCTWLMNHYESLILSQLILLVSSVKSWNFFFVVVVDLHNASNLKVKEKRLENASGDLLSTIKWLNLFLVIFYEAQLLTCWFQCGWHSTRLN